MKYRAIGKVNVRARPDANSVKLGWLDPNDVIDATSQAGADGTMWLAFDVSNNGVVCGRGYAKFGAAGEPWFTQVNGTVTPPPSGKASIKIGANCLHNGRQTEALMAAGAMSATVLNDFWLGAQIQQQYPLAEVSNRRWTNSMPDEGNLDAVINQWLEGARGAKYVSFFNEGDTIGQDPDAIIQRGRIERKVALRMREMGCDSILSAGNFSVGCPEWNDPNLCNAFKIAYAPGYNEGLYAINQHLYRPWPGHVPDEWYEGRDQFMFTRGGLVQGETNNGVKLHGIICDEWGLDQGGTGGYEAHGYTRERFVTDVRELIEYRRVGHVIDGVYVAPHLKKADLFQVGDADKSQGHWGGFYVGNWLGEIGALAREAMGSNVRGLELDMLVFIDKGGVIPARKDMSVLLGGEK